MHQPFFIVGTARCGSSRLWQILDAHPRVCITNEARVVDALHFFVRYANTQKGQRLHCLLDEETDLRGIVPADHSAAFADLLRRHAPRMLEDYYARLADDSNVTHWGDKLPDPEAAHAVQAAIPHTRFIVLVRDPRDAWASWCRYRERPGVVADFPAAAAIDVDAFAHNWTNLYASATSYLQHALAVRYEDLVSDAARTVAGVLRHLDLPDDPGVDRAVEDRGRLRGHATIARADQTIGSFESTLPEDEVRAIEEICARGMQTWDYGPRSG